MRRLDFIAGLGSTVAWPLAARAQQGLSLVGWLGAGASPDDAGESIARVKPPTEWYRIYVVTNVCNLIMR
jgi:hypothetical protein